MSASWVDLPRRYLLMEKVNITCITVSGVWEGCQYIGQQKQLARMYAPTLSTRSAISSNTLPPCITITLDAISSVLYAAASFCTANARSLCTRIADIATFLPLPPSPRGLIPSECAVAQGLELIPRPGPLSEPNAAAESPELARTESSDASSIRRRMLDTERKTPGSIGGGVAFPGLGAGKGGGAGRLAKVLCGESGGEWSPIPANPLSRGF